MRFGTVAALVFASWVLAAPALADEQVKPILDSAEKLKPDAIKVWERLISVDSGTGDAEGVNAVGAVAVEAGGDVGARLGTQDNEAPREQLAVVGRAGAQGQDLVQFGLGRAGRDQGLGRGGAPLGQAVPEIFGRNGRGQGFVEGDHAV